MRGRRRCALAPATPQDTVRATASNSPSASISATCSTHKGSDKVVQASSVQRDRSASIVISGVWLRVRPRRGAGEREPARRGRTRCLTSIPGDIAPSAVIRGNHTSGDRGQAPPRKRGRAQAGDDGTARPEAVPDPCDPTPAATSFASVDPATSRRMTRHFIARAGPAIPQIGDEPYFSPMRASSRCAVWNSTNSVTPVATLMRRYLRAVARSPSASAFSPAK